MSRGREAVMNLVCVHEGQRAHVSISLGNEIGWQGGGGWAGYRGHCKSASPDFAGDKELQQVLEWVAGVR